MATRKEPIYLREKPLSSGRTSLYLEINKDGMRRYEFLKLYLTNGKSKKDKQEDKKILELAEAIRAKRIVELRNSKYGFADLDNGKADMLQYMAMASKKHKGSRYRYYVRLEAHLRAYSGKERIPFDAIDKNFIEGFISYLERYKSKFVGNNIRREQKLLAKSTIHLYVSILNTVLNMAVKVGILNRNPMRLIDKKVKAESGKREFLTEEELGKLLSTNPTDHIRRTFLFGCFTGLRHSDIISLQWEEIQQSNEGYTIMKRQQKTDEDVIIPLNKVAISLLPVRKEKGLVFGYMHSQSYINSVIKKWVKSVGINKNITFHCSRHTFATLLISKGADLYVVSKLLGHTNITTTQIYAKVVDESRRKAVDLLPDFLGTQKNKKG